MSATEPHAPLLKTPGKRVHAAILALAVVYVVGHVALGAYLLDAKAPFTGLLLAVTVLAALGNLFVAVPMWVYTAMVLVRGPRPLVAPPAPVADDALPHIVVQIPGRHEPIEEVRRSIDSVLEADYPRDKLTAQFVDNSDDERWREVAEVYAHEPRVRVEHRDGTRGFKGGNLNHGLTRLGPVDDPDKTLIGLLDVGDTFAPEVLRPMATEMVRDPRLGFVQDMFRTGNPRETIITWSDAYVGDAARRFTEGYAAHYGAPTMNGHCALLRLSALEATGRWDESRVAEDWSTGIRMLAQGWRGKWVDYAPWDPRMVSTELVPSEIPAQQKQKRRWATGGTELARDHFAEWMRSDMPWHYRLSLALRFVANLTVLPTFVVQLILPIWLALALTRHGEPEVLGFGLVSIILQNPYVLATAAAALAYAREGSHRRAAMTLVAYPVQALWRLPVFAHAAIGVLEGLTRGLKDFVITPKRAGNDSPLTTLRSQRLVVLASLLPTVPLLLMVSSATHRIGPLTFAVLAVPFFTVFALLLVPSTQWLRERWARVNEGTAASD